LHESGYGAVAELIRRDYFIHTTCDVTARLFKLNYTEQQQGQVAIYKLRSVSRAAFIPFETKEFADRYPDCSVVDTIPQAAKANGPPDVKLRSRPFQHWDEQLHTASFSPTDDPTTNIRLEKPAVQQSSKPIAWPPPPARSDFRT
jgi:hypothetical protein